MEHIVEVVINWIVILMAVVGGASMVVQGLAKIAAITPSTGARSSSASRWAGRWWNSTPAGHCLDCAWASIPAEASMPTTLASRT
mgnify:CR=1 FL=1